MQPCRAVSGIRFAQRLGERPHRRPYLVESRPAGEHVGQAAGEQGGHAGLWRGSYRELLGEHGQTSGELGVAQVEGGPDQVSGGLDGWVGVVGEQGVQSPEPQLPAPFQRPPPLLHQRPQRVHATLLGGVDVLGRGAVEQGSRPGAVTGKQGRLAGLEQA